jgi:hypothetical protein
VLLLPGPITVGELFVDRPQISRERHSQTKDLGAFIARPNALARALSN